MARSTYIYTVHDQIAYGETILLGAFTVKHEMVTAIESWLRGEGRLDGALVIQRSRDGVIAEPEDITDQFTWGAS